MFCKRNTCGFVKGYRVRGEQRVKTVVINAKWFKCDSYVSDYVFAHCRGIVDLMRRGLWEGGCDGLLAQWVERHSYKMCVPGSIPG